MTIKEMVEGWLFKIALTKGVKAVLALALSFLASVKVAAILTQAGITIDPTRMEQGLTVLGTAGITMLLNWLKLKTSIGKKFL
jgi:hypothetical protein